MDMLWNLSQQNFWKEAGGVTQSGQDLPDVQESPALHKLDMVALIFHPSTMEVEAAGPENARLSSAM